MRSKSTSRRHTRPSKTVNSREVEDQGQRRDSTLSKHRPKVQKCAASAKNSSLHSHTPRVERGGCAGPTPSKRVQYSRNIALVPLTYCGCRSISDPFARLPHVSYSVSHTPYILRARCLLAVDLSAPGDRAVLDVARLHMNMQQQHYVPLHTHKAPSQEILAHDTAYVSCPYPRRVCILSSGYVSGYVSCPYGPYARQRRHRDSPLHTITEPSTGTKLQVDQVITTSRCQRVVLT